MQSLVDGSHGGKGGGGHEVLAMGGPKHMQEWCVWKRQCPGYSFLIITASGQLNF